ncbi:CcdB family protein (plasmid) [Sulfitobacter sp. W027]|uniref:CcdB family protein n=1 Tax=Sulfitobacter sp. W027 TaxID=2867025 RepID=UPI0021A35DCC|nr:CcdB family protein [Sulfitobacter sp. W027]UWR35819.1 CcdB family protein [Sulfitobacter sp. W027]
MEASRVLAPFRDAGRYTAFPGLTSVVHLNGTEWIVRVQELAAVPGSELRERVGSLEEHRDALTRALDILINGI